VTENTSNFKKLENQLNFNYTQAQLRIPWCHTTLHVHCTVIAKSWTSSYWHS